MLAYAADRPLTGKRQSSPHTMLLIVSAHVALLAAAMSARMELPPRHENKPIQVTSVPIPPPPPPQQHVTKPQPQPRPEPLPNWIDHPQPRVPIPHMDPPPVDTGGTTTTTLGPITGAGTSIVPTLPTITPAPIRHEPRLITPPWELKPPYPAVKIASGEEASLNLRLTIDERGRVTAVDPVGSADRAFLEAARRYMIAHWRYQPATEDGRAVGATEVITLRFQLDG